MKFIHRLGYYLGGFSIGLILLAFFLSVKKTSCDYGPNARTTKNIANKKKLYSEDAKSIMEIYQMDTLSVSNLIRYGNVDFSKSDTKSEGCKSYSVENTFKDLNVTLKISNCDSVATIQSIDVKQ